MASRSLRGRRAAAAPATRDGARWRTLRHGRAARALIAHEHRTAAAAFALLVLAFLWPVLVGGSVLAPTAQLQFEVPWAGSAPASVARYVNGDLADVPLSYYPWIVLARAFVRSGTFPAWNPYAFGGTPLFANVQMAWASPFSVPLWILPLPYALGVVAALKLWVAAFGTYLLTRELRLGFWAGLVAGTSFALCAFNVVWLSHGVFVSVAALLPWAIWLTERVVRTGGGGLALAGVVALALTGGHPGTQAHVLVAMVVYALVRTALAGPGLARERLARLGIVGGALVIGALLTAALVLPGERAAHDTVGALVRRHGSPGFLSSMLTPGALRTALFPDWWGRPSEHLAGGPATYRERTFYAGAVPLVLTALALVAPGGWRRKAPFVLLGALGAAVALRMPGLWAVVVHLPVLERIQNGRMLLLFLFAVALLAGFGVQALLDGAVPRRRVAAVLGAALLAVAVAIVSLPAGGNAVAGALGEMARRGHADATPAAVALASVGWWLVLASATAAVAFATVRRPSRRWAAGGALALLVAFDLLRFAHGFQPMGPEEAVVPGRTPAIAFLQHHTMDGARIAGLSARAEDWTLPADWSSTYGLRDIRGYDQPYPTRRWFRLWRIMDPSSNTPYVLSALSTDAPKVLGVLGGRYLIAPPGAALALDGLRVVYDGPDARIYANRLATPRVLVARRVTVAGNEKHEAAAIAAPSFDPRSDAVVRSDELGAGPPLADGGGSARVVQERDAQVTIHATLARRGLVVLGDVWAPGWSVTVDGRPAQALQADMVLRGVVVSGGTHEIVWQYRVPGLRAGMALSGAGLLALSAWAALCVRARRRRRRG